jgi:hypothetical protein
VDDPPGNVSPSSSPAKTERIPPPNPLMMTIMTGSRIEIFLEKLLSRAQKVQARRTPIAGSEMLVTAPGL